MSFTVFVAVALLLAIFYVLHEMRKRGFNFSKRVFAGLGMGAVLGVVLQIGLAGDSATMATVRDWFSLAGGGYMRLLQMVAMPLIFVSVLAAIVRMEAHRSNLASTAGKIIGWLVGLTAVAAVVGFGAVVLFGLDASQIAQGQAEIARGTSLIEKAEAVNAQSVPARLLELLPANPFADLSGSRSTSTIATVIFAALLGVGYLNMSEKKPEEAKFFKRSLESVHALIMSLVRIILDLTPYGVTAILASTVAGTNAAAIVDLGKFAAASYVALAVMMVIHMGALALHGLNPITYLKKASPALLFAFSSRSSAGTLPLNVRTQQERLGVEEGTANLSSSLGTSIGQNGCAGVYPAMLAAMIAPTVGIDIFSLEWIFTMVAVVAISSFGVAGVGGGATMSAILVLSTLNLPIALAGVLISIEPIIDMARTAVNVSGSMVSGLLTSKSNGTLNEEIYNDTSTVNFTDEEAAVTS